MANFENANLKTSPAWEGVAVSVDLDKWSPSDSFHWMLGTL